MSRWLQVSLAAARQGLITADTVVALAVIRLRGFRFRLDLTVAIHDTPESPAIQGLDTRALAVGEFIQRGMTPVIMTTTHRRSIDTAIITMFSRGIMTCIELVIGIRTITDKQYQPVAATTTSCKLNLRRSKVFAAAS